MKATAVLLLIISSQPRFVFLELGKVAAIIKNSINNSSRLSLGVPAAVEAAAAEAFAGCVHWSRWAFR